MFVPARKLPRGNDPCPTLLAIVLFAAPLVKDVPLAALAAILMIVAYNMGEWREIPKS